MTCARCTHAGVTICDDCGPYVEAGRFHFSRFVIVPTSWLLDRIGQHNACDDLDNYAAARGWWHR